MGSVVKSIGKAVKKIGKKVKKYVKKIAPALLVAAAVWAGVAMYGAAAGATGTAFSSAAGAFDWGVSSFSAGLTRLGGTVSGLFSPAGASTTGAGSVPQAAATGGGVNALAGLSGGFEAMTNYTGGYMGALPTGSDALLSEFVKTSASGISTGEALLQIGKWNMMATGGEILAAWFDESEQEAAAAQMEFEEKMFDKAAANAQQLAQMKISAESAAALEADERRYSYGAPSGSLPKNWIQTHPSLQQAGTAAPPQTAMMQKIGQPTLGRRSTQNFETKAPTAAGAGTTGLITGRSRRLV